jgi:hypothetical protein
MIFIILYEWAMGNQVDHNENSVFKLLFSLHKKDGRAKKIKIV